jgi:hypothetical protein
VTTGDVALHFLALLVYPGAVLTLVVGVAAESAVALVLERGAGVPAAVRSTLVGLRRAASGALPPLLAVALLAVLAAAQLAAPLNPVSPIERSLLVAAVALAAAAWLAWSRDWTTAGARAALLVQLCWLVALLAPALVSETLRPQALGAIVVPAELPLKIAAGLLALLSLPALLRVAPGAGPAGAAERPDLVRAARLLLWLPFCGLFTSLFFPAGGDDAGGVLRFLAITVGVAGVTIVLALLSGRALRRLYPTVLALAAIAVLLVAAATLVLD